MIVITMDIIQIKEWVNNEKIDRLWFWNGYGWVNRYFQVIKNLLIYKKKEDRE